MPSLRHSIFDLDGTLVDSLPGITWSVEQALALCGLPPLAVDLKPSIGPPIRSILAGVTGLRDAPSLDRLERAFRASYDAEGWRKTACYEGAPDMLRRLRAGGIGLWVVTNKPSRIAPSAWRASFTLTMKRRSASFTKAICSPQRQRARRRGGSNWRKRGLIWRPRGRDVPTPTLHRPRTPQPETAPGFPGARLCQASRDTRAHGR